MSKQIPTRAPRVGTGPRLRPRLFSWSLLRNMQRLAVYLILIAASVAFLFPLVWMISTSLKPKAQVMAIPPRLIPDPIRWQNYLDALSAPNFNFPLLARNTLIYTLFSTCGIMFSCPITAYTFSRLRWPGRDQVFLATLATMMIPGTVTLIPTFILFRHLGWTGTLLPLIVPSFFGGPFYIFLLRQFFLSIPIELSEAAVIDGASHLAILYRIVVPLAKPALATVALFEFLSCWNDFMGPLIYLADEKKFTLSLGLYAFRERWEIRYDLMMAAATLVTLPILVLFFFTQRAFIEGIALTGIKG
jgi:multiple sugar transport system permease protein